MQGAKVLGGHRRVRDLAQIAVEVVGADGKRGAVSVAIHQQPLAGDGLDAGDRGGEAGVGQGVFRDLAALGRKTHRNGVALCPHISGVERTGAARAAHVEIALPPDSHGGAVDQRHADRQSQRPAARLGLEVARHLAPKTRQRRRQKRELPLFLGRPPGFPLGMIDVLDTPCRIEAAGLEVHIGLGSHAHLGPGGRDAQVESAIAQFAARPAPAVGV